MSWKRQHEHDEMPTGKPLLIQAGQNLRMIMCVRADGNIVHSGSRHCDLEKISVGQTFILLKMSMLQ
ncbi:MAG: hypothetical protein AAFP89_21235 [Bacteroidota bacterium]